MAATKKKVVKKKVVKKKPMNIFERRRRLIDKNSGF